MAGIDFDARYSVAGYEGIAFYLRGYVEHVVESEVYHEDADLYEYVPMLVVDDQNVIAVMVGDDREHIVDVDDLTKIDDEDYCSGCGQIGCGWG